MEVIWNVNPVTVNVVTDVFLLLMLSLWLKMMESITALEIMRNLRQGFRMYSYEAMGSFLYVRFGWSKYRTLRKEGVLNELELRRFRIGNVVAFATFLFSVVLVLVPVLIDNGLDFDFQSQASESTAMYEMIEFRPNPLFIDNMRDMENFQAAVGTCAQLEVSSLGCLDRADAIQELLSANLLESMSFARTLYETASIAQVDVFNSVEFEYVSVDSERNTSVKKECHIEERTDLADYDGIFRYDDESSGCVTRGVWARLIELDMRATKVTTSKPVGGSLGDELKLGDITVRSSVDFISYESFKDERQQPSSMRIEQIKSIGKLAKGNEVFQLSVDSKVRYGTRGAQKLRLIELTRRQFGGFNDPEIVVVKSEFATTTLESSCASPVWEKEGAKAWDLEVEVEFFGVVCTYQMKTVMDNCNSVDIVYMKSRTGDEVKTQEIGFQKVEGVVLLPDGDECGEEAKRRYTRQLTPDLQSDQLGLVLGVQFEIACTKQIEDGTKLNCIFGPDRVFYDGNSFQVERPMVPGYLAMEIKLRSVAAWTAYEIEGGEMAALREVKANVRDIFEKHYPTFRIISNRGVMRGEFLGGKIHFSMRDIIAALSSQILRVDRDVRVIEDAPVTRLGIQYFVGVGIVIGFNFLAGMFVGIRSLWENRHHRSLFPRVIVPTTLSGWIQTALVTNHGRLGSENLARGLTFECRKGSASEGNMGSATEMRTTVDVHFEDEGEG